MERQECRRKEGKTAGERRQLRDRLSSLQALFYL